MGGVGERVQGSGVLSRGDIHPCGKSGDDVGGSAVCSGQFSVGRKVVCFHFQRIYCSDMLKCNNEKMIPERNVAL